MKVLVDTEVKALRIEDRKNPGVEWTEDFIEAGNFETDEDGTVIMSAEDYVYWIGEIVLQEKIDAICSELESLDINWWDLLTGIATNDRDAVYATLRDKMAEVKVTRQVAQNLVDARETAGMSQQSLANHIGTSRQQISRYETGEQGMSVTRLVEIAKAMNIPPESLLEGV